MSYIAGAGNKRLVPIRLTGEFPGLLAPFSHHQAHLQGSVTAQRVQTAIGVASMLANSGRLSGTSLVLLLCWVVTGALLTISCMRFWPLGSAGLLGRVMLPLRLLQSAMALPCLCCAVVVSHADEFHLS